MIGDPGVSMSTCSKKSLLSLGDFPFPKPFENSTNGMAKKEI